MANYTVFDPSENIVGTENDDNFTVVKAFQFQADGSGGDDTFTFSLPENFPFDKISVGFSSLSGGEGNDRWIVSDPGHLLDWNQFDGGNGVDTLELSTSTALAMSTFDGGIGIKYVDKEGFESELYTFDVERFVIKGSAEGDGLLGGTGNDWLDGRGGVDTFQGSAGDDGYVFDSSEEHVDGTDEGIDTIWTTASQDLRQSSDVENLRLKSGDINGTGNALNNLITGSAGQNVIAGGLGNDNLWGKGGADIFAFAEKGKDNKDWIRDFDADDKIQLDKSAFTYLYTNNKNHLIAADFVVGAKATVNHAQVIYDKDTGVLSYDRDGTGNVYDLQEIAYIGKNLAFFDNADIILA